MKKQKLPTVEQILKQTQKNTRPSSPRINKEELITVSSICSRQTKHLCRHKNNFKTKNAS